MATKQKILSIRMHKEKWRKWRKAAQQRDMTLTKLVEVVVEKWLEEHPFGESEIAPETLVGIQAHLPKPA